MNFREKACTKLVAMYLVVIVIHLFLAFSLKVTALSNKIPKCGYDACPQLDSQKHHVHLIAHTHDDVGWLKTVDQYYYGINVPGVKDRAGVQYILDTIVRQLQEDQSRRFIWVETAFFWMWWNKQTPKMQNVVKELVNNGQLEFISGGWSMNDEATVHYQPTIDQMTWGHRRLQDIFGKCAVTKIGWQLDPFGHSKEFASLLSQMYFDGLFFARLDYNDKRKRESENRTEFVWKSGNHEMVIEPSRHIFTGILPMHYYPPQHFCFDDLCKDDPIVDDPNSKEYNVNKTVDAFLKMVESYSKKYATNHLIITFGGDFFYQNALIDFKNIDLLIKYVNERQKSGSKYNLLYSTPTCYLKALHDSNKIWTTKTNDFFPLCNDPHAYWTGFFTSRPAFKLQERKSNAILQACKHAQLWLDENDQQIENAVASLKEAMGVAQHHDAITGTEKQHVANDYALQLNNGVLKCQEVIKKAFHKRMKVNISFCPSLNVSQCEIMEKEDKVAVILYNLRSQEVTRTVSIPWGKNTYVIKDVKGKVVLSDLIPIPESIKTLPERRASTTHEIFFTANIPALQFVTYFIERKRNSKSPELKVQNVPDTGIQLQGKDFVAVFDNKGIVGVKIGKHVVKLRQNFHYYVSAVGDNEVSGGRWERRASGAYIFRPNGTEPVSFQPHIKKPVFINGRVVKEFRQQINSWINQTIRVSRDSKYIEFDYVVGPIPVDDKQGKEVISRFESDITNGKFFYTDANGRQLVRRVRDHRDTYDYNIANEPVSGNYYPVNSRIIIQDPKIRLTVLTDRSQGGSSLSEGSVELMIHRRLLNDDGFGVEEALNEPGVDGRGLVIRGSHKILIEPMESISHRDEDMTEYLEPQLYFYPFKSIEEHTSSSYIIPIIHKELPSNVHLLTAEPWKDGKILIRLEHLHVLEDDIKVSILPVTINLKKVFKIDSAVETTLSATQSLSEAKRLKWRIRDSASLSGGGYPSTLDPHDLTVTLKPMEIRTFLVTLATHQGTTKGGISTIIVVLLVISFLIAALYVFRQHRVATRRERMNFGY